MTHPKARTPATKARGIRSSARHAFTLMETALATIILGVGVLAMVEAQQTFTKQNRVSSETATAMFLANEVRELTRYFPRHDRTDGGVYLADPRDPATITGWGPEAGEALAVDFDDLDDLDGVVFSPAAGVILPTNDFTGQTVSVNRRLSGPIDSFGEFIPEVDWGGVKRADSSGNTLPMRGWAQYVRVSKVHPNDFTLTVAPNATTGPVGIDEHPVRVEVIVFYKDPNDTTADPAEEISRVAWIVPAS